MDQTETPALVQRHQSPKAETGDLQGLATILHDALGSGVLVIGADEQVLGCNPEAEKLLGLAPRAALGKNLSALPAPVAKIIRQALASQQAIPSREVMLAANKSAAVCRLGAFFTQPIAGLACLVVTLSDGVMVRRIEQNLNRLDRLASAGTLSAGMAHEIRNAFVAIKTFVDLLLEKNRDAELAEVVGREMRRIDAIVSQMLRFGAPARPAFASVKVHEVLEHSLRMLQHQFDGKLIALNRHFAAAPDAVNGDDYQLEQAFVNLLFNALEAMGPNGTLSVTTELAKVQHTATPFVRVTVADDGIGISPENMQRLFEPFFTTKQNGTGLGLAITRRIVHEHRGEITATSELNKGTTFHVLLPAHGAAS